MSEIRNLLATCTQAEDARKADAYAGCFAPGGVLELAGPIEGREAIRAWMTAPSSAITRFERLFSDISDALL